MKKIKKFLWILGVSIFVIPTFAFAQPYSNGIMVHGVFTPAGQGGIVGFLDTLTTIMNMLVPIFLGLALIYFVYGLGEYILVSSEEAKKVEGRNRMIYGTIAMFVIVSVWGLVYLLQQTTNTTNNVTPPAPGIPKNS